MTIDDTWPRMSELRSLWNGTTEFWKGDVVNPVAQAEHERRDSHLSVVSHTEDAEEKGRRVILGLPEISNVYSTHHGDSSCATESQDAAIEAANPKQSTTGLKRWDAVPF